MSLTIVTAIVCFVLGLLVAFLIAQRRARRSRDADRTEALRAFIDLTPQAIVALDAEGRITVWNRAAERLFGWTADETIGKSLPMLPPEHRGAFDIMLHKLRRDGTVEGREVVRLRKDGSPVNIMLSASALRDDGRVTGYIAVMADLTERRQLEGQLRQSQTMEAVGRLAGGIAHDFNNILTIITATTALLLDSPLPLSTRTDLQSINTAALRAAALTRQLLAFTRSQVVHIAPVDVDAVLRELESTLLRLLPGNVRLDVAGHARHAIRADVSQIEQIVMNLTVNAVDAMPDGGTVTIRTADVTLDAEYIGDYSAISAGQYVQLSIADTGTGMTPEVLSRLFEPFFTTKPVGKGTGLGLATTYAMVKRMGGCIDVQSTPLRGTTFTIHIPSSSELTSATNPVSDTSLLADARGSETILVVEDDAGVRLTLKRGLQRLGYTVLDAPSGEVAIGMARSDPRRVDVLVTDMMLPGMTGQELADRVHALRPALPVVFMSGYADEPARARLRVDVSHAFLHKPVAAASVARAFQDLLRPSPSPTRTA
jgi:PAS domain S-box-containing protein